MNTEEKRSLLRKANPDTMWGFAILSKLNDQELAIDFLIEQLRSQYRDSPSVMEDILPKEVCDKLLKTTVNGGAVKS